MKISYLFVAASIGYGCCELYAQPNIIYIMSDDHAYQAISAYGHGLNQTPNIDRLAEEGAIFTRSTVTNSISAPSRAVLLTGKHSYINGKIDNAQPFDWDQDNFPKLLQANGYQTAMIGKIHLDGTPQGFDFSMVLLNQGQYYNPEFLINGEELRTIDGYCTDIITDTTLDWIENGRDRDKPFCVLYHQKAPHRAWLPALRHIDEYTSQTFPEPETLFYDSSSRGEAARTSEMSLSNYMNWAGDNKLTPEMMDRLGLSEVTPTDKRTFESEVGRMNPEQRAEWDRVYNSISEDLAQHYTSMSEEDITRWRYQRYMQDYLGCIASVDEGVGELLDYLEESGLAENTIVIYTSDQGFYLGENGWYDKRFMYEQSFRTPLLVRYPKEIEPGTEIDALVQNLDFAPTILDYAGVEIPEEMQGESFRELLSGESDEWRDVAYYTYYAYPSTHSVKRHYGISTQRYKLIHFYYDIDEWELYDLEQDPHELTNLYNNPEYAEIRTYMHHKLDETRAKYSDSRENDQHFIDAYMERRRRSAVK